MKPLGVMAVDNFAGKVDLGTMLIIFAIMLIMFVMLRAWYRTKRTVRTNDSPQRTAARFASSMTDDASKASLEQAIVDLQDYSRDTLAKLDTRARILERLLMDADRRIATLQQLVPPTQSGREAREGPRANLPAGADSAAMSSTAIGEPPAIKHVLDRDRGVEVSSLRSGPASHAGTGAAAPSPAPGEMKQASTADPMEQKRQKVWRLRAQGQSAAQIAVDLNIPRGEVEFMLAMRPDAGS